MISAEDEHMRRLMPSWRVFAGVLTALCLLWALTVAPTVTLIVSAVLAGAAVIAGMLSAAGEADNKIRSEMDGAGRNTVLPSVSGHPAAGSTEPLPFARCPECLMNGGKIEQARIAGLCAAHYQAKTSAD